MCSSLEEIVLPCLNRIERKTAFPVISQSNVFQSLKTLVKQNIGSEVDHIGAGGCTWGLSKPLSALQI